MTGLRPPTSRTGGRQVVTRYSQAGSERRWSQEFYRPGLGRRLTDSVEVDGRRRLTFNGRLTGESVELLAAARGLQAEHPGKWGGDHECVRDPTRDCLLYTSDAADDL